MSDRGAKRPVIVPIFIPNLGCPHYCIFCHQVKITSRAQGSMNGGAVERILEEAVRSARFDPDRKAEVAFYGGTFTNLPIHKISELLGAVTPYIQQGYFESVRVSTRPDTLDDERLRLMRAYGVVTVELGVQSMDDGVLSLTKRGYTPRQVHEAIKRLRGHGFQIGVQLMPGLPGDSEETFMRTVEDVIELRPHVARLYPAVVIRGTEMADWYRRKIYEPWSLDRAVKLCTEACIRLEKCGIRVIRIGLMSSPDLRAGGIIGGPWHEAFGFLVRSAIHLKKIAPSLPMHGEAQWIQLRVPPAEIPLIRGYKNRGLRLIEEMSGAKVAAVLPDDAVSPGQAAIDVVEDRDKMGPMS